MYGFGDDQIPRNDTVELLEDMVTEYLTDIVTPFYNTKHSLCFSFFKPTKLVNFTAVSCEQMICCSS